MHTADFKKELEELKRPVWEKIQEYLPEKEPEGHYAMVREYPKRQGKYFRPGLVLLATEMFGGEREKALLTAAAMQTSEDWLLIHDDFEDHSEERRSTKDEYRPALNQIYGDELAVNAGDGLHIIMWKMLGDTVRFLGDEIGWKIYDKMYNILLTTTGGQYLELDWIRKGKVLTSEEEYYKMAYCKAGYYTVTAPLELGAMTAGILKNKELKKIENWGVPFGLAFQIWDDVMNVTVESSAQGKEKGGDILEGKRTLLLSHLLKNCAPIEKDCVISIYLKPREKKSAQEKEYVLNLMEKYGSIDYAKSIARGFAQKSIEIFDKNTAYLPDTKAKQTIRAGISFVVNRDR